MLKALVGYVAMLLGAIAIFLFVRNSGEALRAPAAVLLSPSSAAGAAATGTSNALFHVLLALAAVVVTGRLLGGRLRSL